jgi:hypothetical protein
VRARCWRVYPCLLAAALCGSAHAQRWRMQYFYDQNDSTLTLLDLKFSSAKHGVASGYLTRKDNDKPVVLITEDGGANWSLLPVKEAGVSLFLLDDKLGWMAGSKRIWKTVDGGHVWRQLPKLPDMQIVYFLDAQRGWAAGEQKKIFETRDGGEHWTELPAAALPETNPDYTTYGSIAFADGRNGMITGWSLPPRGGSELPEWMIPETSVARRERPRLSIMLDTRDGGATWTPSTTSIFGRLARVRMSPKGYGLALIEFTDMFEWPSEVFRLDWKAGGRSHRVYREKNRLITDLAVLPGGGYLAGIEKSDKVPNSPIPGKLKIVESSDLDNWQDMDVDYRATARRAILAALDDDNAWVATDTGMILKLDRSHQ